MEKGTVCQTLILGEAAHDQAPLCDAAMLDQCCGIQILSQICMCVHSGKQAYVSGVYPQQNRFKFSSSVLSDGIRPCKHVELLFIPTSPIYFQRVN